MSKVVVGGIGRNAGRPGRHGRGRLDVTVFQNAIAKGLPNGRRRRPFARPKTERQIWVPFELVTPQTSGLRHGQPVGPGSQEPSIQSRPPAAFLLYRPRREKRGRSDDCFTGLVAPFDSDESHFGEKRPPFVNFIHRHCDWRGASRGRRLQHIALRNVNHRQRLRVPLRDRECGRKGFAMPFWPLRIDDRGLCDGTTEFGDVGLLPTVATDLAITLPLAASSSASTRSGHLRAPRSWTALTGRSNASRCFSG